MYSSVLAVGAHPDDVEEGCGGTLAKFASAGTRVTILTVTNGEKGSFDSPDMTFEDVVQARMAEAIAAAEVVGAEYVSLGAEDQQLFDTSELRYAFADVLRRVEADLVLAPPPVDYQADHVRAGQIALEAVHLSALPQIVLGHPALAHIPVVYYYDATIGLDFQPSFYVDISMEIDKKRAMVAHHASQIRSGKAEHGWDLLDLVEILGRFRGLQAGVKYAEGFQPCLRWPRLRALSAFPF
jgi:LmbE family N-acetylglucosaminyl deacetylase